MQGLLAYDTWKPALPGELFDSSWRAKCSVVPVSRAEAEPLIRRHYLEKWPGVCVLILGMRCGLDLLGIIVFSLPPAETSKRYGGITWELARLWVDDGVPKNGETWLIGKAVRHIIRHRPDVCALVSYADPSAGHRGTIYRAANWQEDGRTDGERASARSDYVDARTGKKYSRRSHVPQCVEIVRVPRVSKWRFVYRLSDRRANGGGNG